MVGATTSYSSDQKPIANSDLSQIEAIAIEVLVRVAEPRYLRSTRLYENGFVRRLLEQVSSDITTLLASIRDGDDPNAWQNLLARVYGPLRKLAAERLRRERAGHTLEPTALVHEAFLRLVGQPTNAFDGRYQFYAAASRAMRQILIESARRRSAAKRGGARTRLDLDAASHPITERVDPADLLALDESLNELTSADPRSAKVVELRVFGGLSIEDTASALEVSHATVERDWRVARAWLVARLTDPQST
jgi:RNA polymerase sigma factor (TIGR02999 family)